MLPYWCFSMDMFRTDSLVIINIFHSHIHSMILCQNFCCTNLTKTGALYICKNECIIQPKYKLIYQSISSYIYIPLSNFRVNQLPKYESAKTNICPFCNYWLQSSFHKIMHEDRSKSIITQQLQGV